MKYVFGVPSDFVLVNRDPRLRYRFRFRNTDFAYAFIKSAQGIAKHILEWSGAGLIVVGEKIEENKRL